MHPFPHHYRVDATASASGHVQLATAGAPALRTAAPAEFDGPGDAWSPETLLVGAVADCFVLSFRAVAAASQMPWTALEVRTDGDLDRVGKVTQFTALRVHARLILPAGVTPERAERLLHRAESACLVSNSLKPPVTLTTEVVTA
jgi:organic hydroperoxide reductase OsmC/OhrA